MNKKGLLKSIGVLAVLAVTLTACAQIRPQATLAAGETSPVAGGGGGGGAVWQQAGSPWPQGLVATGVGTASAEPEIAIVTFGVELRGDDPAAIVNEAADKINQAMAAAQGLGVAQEDIQTTGYNLWVETIYDPEKGTPTGEVVYHVSHYVQATLRDLKKVGDLLAAVVGAGANTISGVSFSVENPDTLIEQARQQALEKARAQAETMAKALDVALGKPVTIMETSGGYPVPMPMVEGMGGGGGGVAAPSISPGTFSVSVSVQVVYTIN